MTALAAVSELRRRPALLLLALLSIPTVVVVAVTLISLAVGDAAAAALVVALAVGSALLVVLLVGWLGGRTVSAPVAAAALAWGAFAAPLVAIPATGWWGAFLAATIAGESGADRSSAFAAGPVEEVSKLLGLGLLAVAWPRSMLGARAGLVAGMFVGLGFGTIEHVGYVAASAIVTPDLGGPAETVAWTFLARAVAAGPFPHVAFTGLAGAVLGWALAGSSRTRWLAVAASVAGVAALHSFANAGPVRAPFLPWEAADIGPIAGAAFRAGHPIPGGGAAPRVGRQGATAQGGAATESIGSKRAVK